MGKIKVIETWKTYDKDNILIMETTNKGKCISYTYDNDGKLINRVITRNKHITFTEYKYDESGNEIRRTTINPDKSVIFDQECKYNEDGTLSEIILGNGSTKYEHENGKVSKILYKDGTVSELQYDDNGNNIIEIYNGKKDIMCYDDNNNLLSRIGSNGYKLLNEYDRNNNKIYSKDNEGETVYYEYDNSNNEIHSVSIYVQPHREDRIYK